MIGKQYREVMTLFKMNDILCGLAIVLLFVGGSALDSNSYIPYILVGIAGIILLVEGVIKNA